MASHGLRDQDWLDDVSNFVIWRARILSVLDEYGIKDHATSVLAMPVECKNSGKLDKYILLMMKR